MAMPARVEPVKLHYLLDVGDVASEDKQLVGSTRGNPDVEPARHFGRQLLNLDPLRKAPVASVVQRRRHGGEQWNMVQVADDQPNQLSGCCTDQIGCRQVGKRDAQSGVKSDNDIRPLNILPATRKGVGKVSVLGVI